MPHPDALRLGLLYGALFLALGLQLTCLPLWLAGRGFSGEAIGLVLGAGAAARALGGSPLARLGDGPLGARGVLVRALLAALLLAAGLAAAPGPGTVQGVMLVGALQVALALALAPAVPLADVLALEAGRRLRVNWGRMRAAGSVTFVLGALLGGAAVERAGSEAVAPLLALCLGLALGAAALAPPGARRPDLDAGAPAPRLGQRAQQVIAAAALAQGSHATLYAFGPLAWNAAGITPVWVGVLWGAAVAAEVVLLWAVPVTGRALPAALRLLALGAGGGALRWLALALAPPLPVLLPLQALHALSFAATQLGAVAALEHLAPPGARARAQGALAAASSGAMGLLTLVAGRLYEGTGGLAFAAMAAPAGLALALALHAARR